MYNPLKDKNLLWAFIGLNTATLFFAVPLGRIDLICLSLASMGLCFLGTLNAKNKDD